MGILTNIMPIKLGILGAIEDTKAHNHKSAREIPELNNLAKDLLLSEEFENDDVIPATRIQMNRIMTRIRITKIRLRIKGMVIY